MPLVLCSYRVAVFHCFAIIKTGIRPNAIPDFGDLLICHYQTDRDDC